MSLRYRALLIGNWHYPQDPANLPDLNGPLNDVAGLAKVLTTGPGSLFHPADVTTVTERASYEICEAIEHFLDVATRYDVLLLYYSGHGFTDAGGTLRLTGRNSRYGQVANTVGADDVSDMIRRCAAAVVVIVLDCCHAGAFKGGDLATQLAGKGRFVLAASRSKQSAPDAEVASGTSRFTGHLLRGIQGEAALPGAEYVTITDLYQYVIRKMAAEGPIRPQRQFDGEGDPPIARGSRAAATVTSRAPTAAAAVAAAPTTAPESSAAQHPAVVVGADLREGSPPSSGAGAVRLGAPAGTAADRLAPIAAAVREYRDAVPGIQVEPAARSRLERSVRKLGGVSERERTLALVGLPGGGAVLFTDPALYWMAKDRGTTVTALSYRDLAERTFRAVAAVAGQPPTHVELGDGVARYAGPAAHGLTALLNDLRAVVTPAGSD